MKRTYPKPPRDDRQNHPNQFIFVHERSTPNHEVYSTAINSKGDRFKIWIPDDLIGLQAVPRYFPAFCAKEEGSRRQPVKRRKNARSRN
jgi:hypothetical protein